MVPVTEGLEAASMGTSEHTGVFAHTDRPRVAGPRSLCVLCRGQLGFGVGA